METRSRAKAKEVQSSSSPVSRLEDSGQRPSSRASEVEGDLGLTSLLGGGEVIVVGRSHTPESAISGSCDVTLVAAQVPNRRPELGFSDLPAMDTDTTPLQIVTRTTMLPGPCVQTPTSGMEPMATKSSYPQRPVQIPTHVLT